MLNHLERLNNNYNKSIMNTLKQTPRIATIDIFRALTMLLMIFVNDFYSVRELPHWLHHAALGEDMLGLSDIVFPAFLFVMGISIPIAIENRFRKGDNIFSILKHIALRTIALWLMGLFMVNYEYLGGENAVIERWQYSILMGVAFFLIFNIYPKAIDWKRWLYIGLRVVGIVILIVLYLNYTSYDGKPFATRWWGILGIIGWVYLVCALFYLTTRQSMIGSIGVWLIFVGSSILLTQGVVPYYITDYLPVGWGTHDAFTMSGVCVSLVITKYLGKISTARFIAIFITLGVVMFGLGLLAHQMWIVSKLGSTPTWLFYCLAMFFPAFALLYWICDVKGYTSWAKIIAPAGVATLTCYIIPYFFYIPYPEWLPDGSLGLIKCAIFSLLCIQIVGLLGRIGIKLKI